ncbi:hypothetical protein [Flavobacterium sp. FlaQc-48]|uniref:hypothetical protein n=1 Tax=Flavobacterium sp. FlaQc-48 TaxID=3374181 RepID=UPI0037569E1A
MMNIRNLYISFLSVTIITGLLIILKVPYFNFLSLIYGFILYPFYITKLLNLAFKMSSHVKKKHPEFYEKHKTFTSSFEGKMISLDKSDVLKLNDKLLLEYHYETKKLIALLFYIFLSIFMLTILIIVIK